MPHTPPPDREDALREADRLRRARWRPPPKLDGHGPDQKGLGPLLVVGGVAALVTLLGALIVVSGGDATPGRATSDSDVGAGSLFERLAQAGDDPEAVEAFAEELVGGLEDALLEVAAEGLDLEAVDVAVEGYYRPSPAFLGDAPFERRAAGGWSRHYRAPGKPPFERDLVLHVPAKPGAEGVFEDATLAPKGLLVVLPPSSGAYLGAPAGHRSRGLVDLAIEAGWAAITVSVDGHGGEAPTPREVGQAAGAWRASEGGLLNAAAALDFVLVDLALGRALKDAGAPIIAAGSELGATRALQFAAGDARVAAALAVHPAFAPVLGLEGDAGLILGVSLRDERAAVDEATTPFRAASDIAVPTALVGPASFDSELQWRRLERALADNDGLPAGDKESFRSLAPAWRWVRAAAAR